MPSARSARRVKTANSVEGGDHRLACTLATAAAEPNPRGVQLNRNSRGVGRVEGIECGKTKFIMKPLRGLPHSEIDRAGSDHDVEGVLDMPWATDTAFGIDYCFVEPHNRVVPATLWREALRELRLWPPRWLSRHSVVSHGTFTGFVTLDETKRFLSR